MTDRELLGQFVERDDPAAFGELVLRHGPRVLAACRRILHDTHRADDTFQATFLLLFRKAATIQNPDTLGNWLYGVALRIAIRTRRQEAHRRELEQRQAEGSPRHYDLDHPWSDLKQVVHEELDNLPGPYHTPLLLCYLEGLTHEQAAEQLRWPLGTVKTRLLRGRKMLRSRLERRGIALGLALLWLIGPREAAAEVTDTLLEATLEATRAGGRRSGPAAISGRPCPPDSAGRWRRFTLSIQGSAAILVVLAFLLCLSCGSVLAFHATRPGDEDALALPANLTDILNVDCR